MPLTTKEVVTLYTDVAWAGINIDIIDEIVADSVIRHGCAPLSELEAKSRNLTRAEAKERIRSAIERFPDLSFTFHYRLVDGEFATDIWDSTYTDASGEKKVMSGIEVFRVVDGRITEVWNVYGSEVWN
jgi:hypothetical protein